MSAMEVTKREALASVGIVGVMLVIGLLISGKIWEAKLDQDQVYQAAAQITESELFEYGMRTSLGPHLSMAILRLSTLCLTRRLTGSICR